MPPTKKTTPATPPAAPDDNQQPAPDTAPARTRQPRTGDVVRVQTGDDTEPVPALVVGNVTENTNDKGDVIREAGVHVVTLPGSVFVPATALVQD